MPASHCYHLAIYLILAFCHLASAGEVPVYPGLAWGTIVSEHADMMSRQVLTVDSAGNAIVAGGFETSMGTEPGFDTTYRGGMNDAYVAKFSRSGVLQWGMYIGGFDWETAKAVTTDADGNIYLLGNTASGDFPVTQGLDTTLSGWSDIFLVKLSPAGDLVWARYIGGDMEECADDIAVLPNGNVILTGTTSSSDFAVAEDMDPVTTRVFAARFTPDGHMLWAKAVAPSMGAMMGPVSGIAVTSAGELYVAGQAEETYTFTVPGGFDTTLDGMNDIFLMHLDASGEVDWGTFIGGDAGESFGDVDADSDGNIIIAGRTGSSDFALMGDPMMERLFVAKVSPTRQLLWARAVVSGWVMDGPMVAPAPDGTVYFTCDADSMSQFPTPGGFDTSVHSMGAAYVARLTAAGSIEWGTYIEGDQSVSADDIALAADRGVYLVGYSNSSDFPPGRPVDPMAMYGGVYVAKLADFRLSVGSAPFDGVAMTGDKPGTTAYSAVCDQGEEVGLSAPPVHTIGTVRYDLVHWIIDGVPQPGQQADVAFTMDDSVTAEAVYSVRQWTLTLLSAPFTGIGITGSLQRETVCTEILDDQTQRTLTAPPEIQAGGRSYMFARWLLNNIPQPDGLADLSLVMNKDHTALAMYELEHHVLTVKSSPISGVEITGDKPGVTTYLAMCVDNELVKLSAPESVTVGDIRYEFVRWVAGAVNQPDGQSLLQVVMDDDTTLTAVYEVAVHTLTVLSSPVIEVQIEGTEPGVSLYQRKVDSGQRVYLTAPGAVSQGTWNCTFVRWIVDNVPQPIGQETLMVLVAGDHTVMALYDWRLPGDTNADCVVNLLDLLYVRNRLGTRCSE